MKQKQHLGILPLALFQHHFFLENSVLKLIRLSLVFKLKLFTMDTAGIVKELSEDMWCLIILEFIQISFNSYVNKRQKFLICFFTMQIIAQFFLF